MEAIAHPLQRRKSHSPRQGRAGAILEELANLPVGPDAQDYSETDGVQPTLEANRQAWLRELRADKRLNQQAIEMEIGQRMVSLQETPIADRPHLYLDVEELAHRYHWFPRDELTPEQREAVEEFYGPEDGFWVQPDDI